MKSISVPITVTAIVAITLLSGIVQGKLSGRWGPSVDLVEAGQALARLPSEIGDWKVAADGTIGDEAAEMLRCTGSVLRTYENRGTGQTVRVAFVVGPPGPISVHIPEICYSSQDYTQLSERRAVPIKAADGTKTGEFWSLSFESNDLNGAPLTVYYAWSSGEDWQANENPRVAHSRAKVLYKVQLAGHAIGIPSGTSDESDPCGSFLKAYLSLPYQFGEIQ